MEKYGNIIDEIISQIFEKFANVFEIQSLLDAIIKLYAGKTGKILKISESVHNSIITNMIYQCSHKKALSASQAVDVWNSFKNGFEWICSIEIDEYNDEERNKQIALRALCHYRLLWS